MTRRRVLAALAVAAAALLSRGPLHLLTYGQPVSNDDAIPLLMARHVLEGELSTILWNQPYNGTLDSYLLAPGLLVAPAHGAFRAYEALCAVLLIVAAGRLASRLSGERAGWSAALLAAIGTPYLGLMAATGPTPNFLVPLLTAVPLLVAWRGATSLPAVAVAGLASGLAVWDSALALPALLGLGGGLLLAGARASVRAAGAFAAGFAVGASPLAIARVIGASASSPVTAIRPRWLWLDGLSDLAHAAAGLFGVQVPLVVDGPQRAGLPWALGIVLALALAAAVAIGAWRRQAWPLVAWGVALCAAFASSRRTGADEIRYLYGLALPALALAGAGLARVSSRRPLAAALALAIAGPWLVGHQILRAAWRDPTHADRVWEVPRLEPVLDTLHRANVSSAYASLQFAGRLALESNERLRASQAWNERIPGDPLRFRDEVDLDPRPAWVLSSRLSRGMPRAGGFRDLLQQLGGRWREDAPADFVVFRQFVPPFDESRPVPADAYELHALDGTPLPLTIRDRDPGTVWTSPQGIVRGSGLEVHLAARRRLSALVLTADLHESPLGVPWVAEVDGVVEARGPMRHALQWVNGAPRAGKQGLLTIPLGDRAGSSVRLIFQGAGPVLRIGEVFLYGPEERALYGPDNHFEPPRDATLAAEQALASARAGDWDAAVASYAQAVRLEPERASLHACLLRARWRAAGRRVLDVESLDDGGPDLVNPR